MNAPRGHSVIGVDQQPQTGSSGFAGDPDGGAEEFAGVLMTATLVTSDGP
jgi:hypothetical protein